MMFLQDFMVPEHGKKQEKEIASLMKHLQGEYSASIFPRLTGGFLKKPKEQWSVEEPNRGESGVPVSGQLLFF